MEKREEPKPPAKDGVVGVPKAGVEDGVPNAGVEDGVPNAGVEEGVPNAGVEDGVPKAGVEDGVPNIFTLVVVVVVGGRGKLENVGGFFA